ncbi:hypothetical protein H6P81_008583 [Aristolochia fimbriata]|uniref:Uncharacterized protein n=1 Tax=Aristolochia fimbriata TaxID=158543 RepID=A0AAV7EIN4_ARIFI|nr:hypothetical protein H6P81_008583 [Aristolochia fimbriata]
MDMSWREGAESAAAANGVTDKSSRSRDALVGGGGTGFGVGGFGSSGQVVILASFRPRSGQVFAVVVPDSRAPALPPLLTTVQGPPDGANHGRKLCGLCNGVIKRLRFGLWLMYMLRDK